MGNQIYGLLGRSLGHSHSVFIHRELENGSYRLFELEPEELGAFLRRNDIGGLNVTIPYKRDVIPFCDALDETARAVGSVNTIVRDHGGRLVGYNTDVYGLTCMAERACISFAGRKVVVFGSGGASLTAQYAAKNGGAKEVVVISRKGSNTYETLSRHADAELLVNATPVGMYPNVDASPVRLDSSYSFSISRVITLSGRPSVFSHILGLLRHLQEISASSILRGRK